jgi:hypothetical protein
MIITYLAASKTIITPGNILDQFSLIEEIQVNLLNTIFYLRFELLTGMTVKNGVSWDVTPCGSCKNRRFEGT